MPRSLRSFRVTRLANAAAGTASLDNQKVAHPPSNVLHLVCAAEVSELLSWALFGQRPG